MDWLQLLDIPREANELIQNALNGNEGNATHWQRRGRLTLI